ncbi:hypothetical protein RFI_07155 [Reticulomyxa filosa]|uniref:Bifunctional lysine-specific demethylase and histidyl-hydroxylase n=1 Tax=Reticulomyxa filosa TaxID=46433 RepID=X6NXG9_RETFI|nr:hypothetical protein RFI_07155 [Reticulomyxa filosa]|eukprot:ETO29962.1 hypothetical protein RFI_07155 [Reticulomyxa filosa]
MKRRKPDDESTDTSPSKKIKAIGKQEMEYMRKTKPKQHNDSNNEDEAYLATHIVCKLETHEAEDWKSPEGALRWLLQSPLTNKDLTVEKFNKEFLHVKPLYISRENATYYEELGFSFDNLCQISDKHTFYLGEHIMCKKYDKDSHLELSPFVANENGEEALDELSGQKLKKLLREEGYTIQMHHLQHYNTAIHELLYQLECYYKVLFGSNVYITKRGTQGLAPHFDDVDVFVLQLEGEKKWHLLQLPPSQANPIRSSENLNLDEIGATKLMECVLKPGDLLC